MILCRLLYRVGCGFFSIEANKYIWFYLSNEIKENYLQGNCSLQVNILINRWKQNISFLHYMRLY